MPLSLRRPRASLLAGLLLAALPALADEPPTSAAPTTAPAPTPTPAAATAPPTAPPAAMTTPPAATTAPPAATTAPPAATTTPPAASAPAASEPAAATGAAAPPVAPTAPAPDVAAPTTPAYPETTLAPPSQLVPIVITVPFGGRVLRKGDRTPVVGVTVIFDDGDPTTITDDKGAFSFDAVPVGEHKVHVRGTDLTPSDTTEKLVAGKRLEVSYYVDIKRKYTSTVRSRRIVKETVEHTLDVTEIQHIAGTNGDLLKSVQNLPGVARAPFNGGQIIAWGSSPQDTRVYVDGAYIPTLFHFGGLRSTVNAEMIQSLTFLPGGYGVDYGRGLGGVVDIESRKPRDDGYHGFVQLDIIDASLKLEGPITKDLTVAISARRSWLDLFLPLFTPNNLQLSPKYWDYQARVHWHATARDDFELFIFGSDDTLDLLSKNPNPDLEAAVHTHTFYHRLVTRWVHRFLGGATLTVTPSVGYDSPNNFSVSFGPTSINIGQQEYEYDLRAVARIPVTKWMRIDAGIDFEGAQWSLAANSGTSGGASSGAISLGFSSFGGTVFENNFAPYVATVLSFFQKRLTITPALRFDLFSFSGNSNFTSTIAATTTANLSHPYQQLEPRLSFRVAATDWLSIKGSIGVYNEAPQPGNLLVPFGDPNTQPEQAVHYVFGVDLHPTSTLSIEAEGFYKDMRNMIVGGEHPNSPRLENEGIGRVYGGEALIKQELWHGLFAWVSYTLSRSERKDHPDTDWHVFQYDQTHILAIIASYQFGRGYQVGARFRYVTGNPDTPTVGAYFDGNTGSYRTLSGPTNSTRVGAFNELDLRFDKKWTYRWWAFSAYLDIQNVYNASNPELYQYNYNGRQSQPVAGLPFLPVLGFRGDF